VISYRVRYTPEAASRIRKLHPQVKQEIRVAVRTLLDTPFIRAFPPEGTLCLSFLPCAILQNYLSTE